MRIVLATPLYPPEIAEPAPYIKELAKRLSVNNTVTVVAYTHLPETVANVRIIAVDKRRPLPLRLVLYFFALLRAIRHADVVYAMNGASVEFPVSLATLFTNRPLIFYIGDVAAHERAKHSDVLRLIERFAFARAKNVLTDTPQARPEVMPFQPFPTGEMEAYARSWDAHVRILEDSFSHVA